MRKGGQRRMWRLQRRARRARGQSAKAVGHDGGGGNLAAVAEGDLFTFTYFFLKGVALSLGKS